MTYASTLIEEVSNDLDDQWDGEEYTRWSQDDLLEYLNDAEKMLAFFLPSSYTPTLIYKLVAGTKQAFPDGTASFLSPTGSTHPKVIEPIKITRNMGADGLTAGALILPIDPKDMDEVMPSWRSTTASANVIHALFDKSVRSRFEVYPPQPPAAQGYIEMVGSAVPSAIVKSGDSYDVAINMGDEFIPTLKVYMRFRAYSRDAKSSQPAYARALDAWNMFLTLVGRKDLITNKLPDRRGLNGNSNQPVSQ